MAANRARKRGGCGHFVFCRNTRPPRGRIELERIVAIHSIRCSAMLTRPIIFSLSAPLLWAQEKITYDDHVAPVFQQACLNCHNPDKAKGGLDLSSYPATMKGSSGGKIVEPGDLASTLIGVVEQTAEPKMPPEGEALSKDQIAILKRWIEGGLLENSSSSAKKPGKPKFAATLQTDPASRPDGPPPMPMHLLLEPPVVTAKASAIHAIATSPWAPLLAVTGQRQVLLHHTESLELVGILPFPEGDPISLTFTPDARYLLVGGGVPGKSGITVTYDITNGSRLLSAGKEFDAVLAADIRPGFDVVATGGPSRLLKLWDTGTGDLIKSIKKHTDWITGLDLSPDGVLLASGDRNGGVYVWESDTGNEFHTLRAHQAGITAAVFRGDSNILGTASEDGTLRFWEMNGGSEVKKIDAHPGGVTAFSFARDGSSLSVGRDMKAKFWKADFNPIRDIIQNLPSLPTAAALDAEAKFAFIGDASGTVLVFNTADGKKVGEIPGNPPAIETRLQTINAEIARLEAPLQTAHQTLATRLTARDQARKAVEESEAARNQAAEAHQAAEAAAVATPDDPSRQRAAEALAKVQATEHVLTAKRTELDTAEKSLAEATAARDAAQSPLPPLQAAHRKWTAAAINTRVLQTTDDAALATANTEEAVIAFTQASHNISKQADILNRKRAERSELVKRQESIDPATPPEAQAALHAEIDATLSALDTVIGRELAALKSAEAELDRLGKGIDPLAKASAAKTSELNSLRQAYQLASTLAQP